MEWRTVRRIARLFHAPINRSCTLAGRHAQMNSMASSTINWSPASRYELFQEWLQPLAQRMALQLESLRPASADASFRRYFRVDGAAGAYIVMDAPVEHENCQPFVEVAELLRRGGIHVPQVLDWNAAHGFMLLSDLGHTTYLTRLDTQAPAAAVNRALYGDAIDALVRMQAIPAPDGLPAYDAALLQRELDLFPQWYLQRHLGLNLDAQQQAGLQDLFKVLLDNNLAQARVLVHRDYHSRNLMVSDPNPGVLDFQDAVCGPITYDLVSLLRDAYVEWDEEVQIDYAVRYWERARKAGLPVPQDFADFWRDFEWMGVQRQLKVLGIFARLAHRDGKPGYLNDIPRVWGYAHRAAMRYRPLHGLAVLLESAAGVSRQAGYTF